MPPTEWKNPREGQQMTWQCGMRKCTANVGKAGVSRLRSWSPIDLRTVGWRYWGIQVRIMKSDDRVAIFCRMRTNEEMRIRAIGLCIPCVGHFRVVLCSRFCRPPPCLLRLSIFSLERVTWWERQRLVEVACVFNAEQWWWMFSKLYCFAIRRRHLTPKGIGNRVEPSSTKAWKICRSQRSSLSFFELDRNAVIKANVDLLRDV